MTFDYDEVADVLYGAVGAPQPALSCEVETDILLRYVPLRSEVVGITIIDFLRQFPQPSHQTFISHAKEVLGRLLRTYPQIPTEIADP